MSQSPDRITDRIARTPAALAEALGEARARGGRVGLVPTMGAIHDGHLSLVRLAAEQSDVVVASLFVNPTQFAPNEDFDAYPRREAEDVALLTDAGCAHVYAPSAATMYPEGFATKVIVGGPAEGLEAAARPHFFHGVATVVAKLLNQTRPDLAVFGEKDYQQLLVIKRLNEDLDLGVEILAGPTMREPDGLAMSSRNAYLDRAARKTAGALNAILTSLADEIAGGALWCEVEARGAQRALDAGFDAVDYVAVRRADDLATFPGEAADAPARVLAAVRLGEVRLIDNVPADAPR
ncbi:MAG: pantoate--beta-alanine ligase [Maricaulaceae bacterium]